MASSDQLSRTPAGARSWAEGLNAQSGRVLTRRRPPVNESAAANPLTLISRVGVEGPRLPEVGDKQDQTLEADCVHASRI